MMRDDSSRMPHPGDAGRADAGVGDQLYCPHGDPECAQPDTPPCWDCLVMGGDDA